MPLPETIMTHFNDAYIRRVCLFVCLLVCMCVCARACVCACLHSPNIHIDSGSRLLIAPLHAEIRQRECLTQCAFRFDTVQRSS